MFVVTLLFIHGLWLCAVWNFIKPLHDKKLSCQTSQRIFCSLEEEALYKKNPLIHTLRLAGG